MALFSNIAQLKTSLGGAISKTVDLVNIQPFIDKAVYEFLIPKISQEQYNALVTPPNNEALNPKQNIALGFMRNAVAWYALFEYSSIGNVIMTEGGLQRIENDTVKTAFKYQENEYRTRCITTAYFNLDFLLKHLLSDAEDFATYHASPQKTSNTAYFINSPSDCLSAGALYPDRYTFEALIPYIADVHEFCVVDFLGATLFNTLHAAQFTPDEDAETAKKQAHLITLIRKGIMEFVLHLAVVGNVITFKGSKVLIKEAQQNDASMRESAPSEFFLKAEAKQRRDWSDRYFARAERYIRENETLFSDWQGFDVVDTTTETITIQSDFFHPAATNTGRLKYF